MILQRHQTVMPAKRLVLKARLKHQQQNKIKYTPPLVSVSSFREISMTVRAMN